MLDQTAGLAYAPSEAERVQMRLKSEQYEREERLRRAQHEAQMQLQPVLQVITSSLAPEDIIRARDLLKPLAVEILSR